MKEGWIVKKLGEVCEILDSLRKPVTKKDRREGIYPYYGASGIQDYVDSYIFDGRYLLVGEDGAKWGASDKSAYIIEGKSWVNNHAHILKVNSIINDKLLEYYLVFKDLSEYITGAIVPKLTQQALRSIPIPIPPLPEQSRIVEELDLLSNIIEKKRQQLSELDNLAQSIFYDMFGDPNSNDKNWERVKFDSICKNLDCERKPITAKDRLKGNIPYYGASGIVDYVKDYIFDGDFLLISEDGANLSVRHTPIAFRITGKTWVNNHAHIVQFDDIISMLFVEYYINLLDISDLITGCAQPKLTQANLNNILIFDVPLKLQQFFAQKIESIEQQKALIKQSIAETEELFNSKMDYYFN